MFLQMTPGGLNQMNVLQEQQVEEHTTDETEMIYTSSSSKFVGQQTLNNLQWRKQMSFPKMSKSNMSHSCHHAEQ